MEDIVLLHFANENDCFALDRNQFCIRFKITKGTTSRAFIHICDKYISHISKTPLPETILKFPMKKVASDGIFDYFEAIVFERMITFSYFFEIVDSAKASSFYGNLHWYKNRIECLEHMFECPQIARFHDALFTPSWAKGAIGYQIFPDSFARLHERKEQHVAWNKVPIMPGDRLGGELVGITAHLNYIKELGVDFIYLNSIFSSTTAHRYNITDYYKIDPELGTKKDFIQFVKKAHKLGLKVVLDGVFNHVSTEFFAFKDVINKQEKSKYKDWFYIEDFPIRNEVDEKPNYESFSYMGGMPKLNLTNPKVQKYILSVVQYWMKKAHIDGWRISASDEMPLSFLEALKKTVKSINSAAIIVAENWHYDFSSKTQLFDSVTNYPFYYALKNWLILHEYRITDFAKELSFMRGNFPYETYHTLWNMIDSHDTPRLISECESLDDFLLAVVLQLTLPGSPIIYYGDEVGLNGYASPDSRRAMLWDDSQNITILNMYKKLIMLRNSYPALKTGDFRMIDAVIKSQLLIFSRYTEEEEIRIIINASNAPQSHNVKGKDLLSQLSVLPKIPAKSFYIVQVEK